MKDVNKTLKATIHGHDFSYSWTGGSQISKMCEGVEEWQGGVSVECGSIEGNQRINMGKKHRRLKETYHACQTVERICRPRPCSGWGRRSLTEFDSRMGKVMREEEES